MSSVFCMGEVLWDCMPQGLFLGGAPFNVASHLARLGINAGMISAVGDDVLGTEVMARMASMGVDNRYVSVVEGKPTGTVSVSLDDFGSASYRIREDVAWDHISFPQELAEELSGASAVVYGTLAMRSEDNLKALEAMLEVEWPMRVYDVNLRSPYYNVEQVLALSRFADLIKCNEDEARELCSAPASASPETLLRAMMDVTGAGRVCITLGAKGAVYHGPGGVLHAIAPRVRSVDTVGAGDAFLAALVAGIVEGQEDHPDFLPRACRLGAHVASCQGAVPAYRAEAFTLCAREPVGV